MKTFLKIALVLILAVAAGGLFWQYEWKVEKDILYLKDGQTILADRSWKSAGLVYYEDAQGVHTVDEAKVELIGVGDAVTYRSGGDIIKAYYGKLTGKEATNTSNDKTNGPPEGLSRFVGYWPWGIGIVVAVMLLYLLQRKSGPKKPVKKPVKIKERVESRPVKAPPVGPPEPKDTPMPQKVVPPPDETATASVPEEDPDLPQPPPKLPELDPNSPQDVIVAFFLQLHRLQMGAPADATVAGHQSEGLAADDPSEDGGNRIYELKVFHNGEWLNRRMTIGPLGEESGAKSKCYYVIFDVHMVIKVPPKPIKSFDKYLENIQKESKIVEQLAPRECIVPKVSVILKRVHQFPDEKDLSPDQLEQRYIKWLKSHPEAQRFLKIGEGFVYFMDLSRYFFLGHIMENFHNHQKRLQEEMVTHAGTLWDANEFSGRYGAGTGTLSMQLQEIYNKFEAQIQTYCTRIGQPELGQTYQIKEWFLTGLIRGRLTEDIKEVSKEYLDGLNKTMEGVFKEDATAIRAYRDLIRNHVRNKAYYQNKAQIQSIISNLLDLLAWMEIRKVAMRDLKPDNLLVAGNTADYPLFLTSPKQFSIGLIDVETAVSYKPVEGQKIPQPQLGGTPFYATPAHLCQNQWLEKAYADLAKVLHMQDWQATVAMIYKTITGTILFENTGKMLPMVKTFIQKSINAKKDVKGMVKEVNRIFWQSAFNEFVEKVRTEKARLRETNVWIPGKAQKMLAIEARVRKKQIDGEIKKKVDGQTLFPGNHNRAQLIKATYRQIRHLEKQYATKGKKEKGEERATKVVRWLRSMALLKLQREKLTMLESAFNETNAEMTAYDILWSMFSCVKGALYLSEWGDLFETEYFDGQRGENEEAYEATI